MKNLNAINPNYLLKAGHDLMFLEIREWKSDLQFYLHEMKFFQKLLDKAFLRITTKKEIDALELLSKQAKQSLELKCSSLLSDILKHENELEIFEELIYKKSDDKIMDNHNQLKETVIMFIGEMRAFKSDLFRIVEEIIQASKMATKGYEEGSITL